MVRSLWLVLAAGNGIISGTQAGALITQVIAHLADEILPERRKRSCPRKVRQPTLSWPRLTKNSCEIGNLEYEILNSYTQFPNGIGPSAHREIRPRPQASKGQEAPVLRSQIVRTEGAEDAKRKRAICSAYRPKEMKGESIPLAYMSNIAIFMGYENDD